jgi:CHASE3 domain sensor protein
MVRKLISLILLSALIFLSTFSMFSCRSVKKNKIKADSTISRSEQTIQKWDTETITEVLLDADELVPYMRQDSIGLMPSIFGIPVKQSHSILSKLGFKKAKNQEVTASTIKRPSASGKVLIRRIEKSSGKIDSKKQEHKQVKVMQVDKIKETDASGLIAVGIGLFSLLVIIIILYHSKKRG